MEEPEIIFRGGEMMVVNKPSGWLSVGRGKGKSSLEEWLVCHYQELEEVERSGIVHRLDRETSGGIIVALNKKAFGYYQSQFGLRKVKKNYWCLVGGKTSYWGRIEMPLVIMNRGRVVKRKVGVEGKVAISEFWREGVGVKEGREYSLLKVRIYTGRTHQIRVHLAYLGWPIVGDNWYGKEQEARLMLHEGYLGLKLNDGEDVEINIPMPKQMKQILRTYEIKI